MNDTHAKTRIKYEIDKRLHFKQHTLQIGDLIIYEPLTSKIHNKQEPKRSLSCTIHNKSFSSWFNYYSKIQQSYYYS